MGVDTDRYAPSDAPKEQPPLLLTVARLNPGKAIDLAFEALARLKAEGVRARYLVIGEGEDRPRLERRVAELGLQAEVDLPGTGSEEEVVAAWRRASVGVLTSVGTFETTPVAIKEGMSMGVPAVVSRIGGTPLMVESGRTGFIIEQRDVAELSAALRTLLMDENRRASMGRLAREHAVEHFDYRGLARRLHAGLEHAIRTPRAPVR